MNPDELMAMQGGGMPQGGMDDGPMMLVPEDGDPFGDPESIKAVLTNIALVEQRILSIELTVAQSVQALGQVLAQMGQSMAMLAQEQERLRQTMAAPKRIVRDAEGRPHGVVIDQPN